MMETKKIYTTPLSSVQALMLTTLCSSFNNVGLFEEITPEQWESLKTECCLPQKRIFGCVFFVRRIIV